MDIINSIMQSAMGLPEFTTDLYMPEYKDGDIGEWRISHTGMIQDRGYYSGIWGVYRMPILMRKRDDRMETWMSLSPHELESQEIGCRYAFGDSVVMGLGMGWIAINMAINSDVKSVKIIERDPAVIGLFEKSGVCDRIPDEIMNKIEIIEHDALTWKPEGKIDFLYADIWLNIDEPNAVDDTRKMQNNIQAEKIYFWGQEIFIHQGARNLRKFKKIDSELIEKSVREIIKLPLLIPDDFDYAGLIENVIHNRIDRNLPVDVKI